ncbi:MAG: glycosyltransferase [bacterium]
MSQVQTTSNTTPQCSIILPFKNAASYLEECIVSILNQKLSSFELIALNDHSSDESELIIQSFADSRIRLIRASGNGLVDALNQGLQQAKSHLIARMDADDLMRAERLQLQVAEFKADPDLSILGSRVKLFPKHDQNRGHQYYVDWLNSCLTQQQMYDQIYLEAPFAHPSVMFKKSALLQLGGYRKGDFPEDYDLWLRAVQAGLKLGKINQTLLDWRDSQKRLSRTHKMYRRQNFDQLRCHYMLTDQRITRSKRLAVWGAGRMTRKRVQLIQKQGIKISAWIDVNQQKRDTSIEQAPILMPDQIKAFKPDMILIYIASHGARQQVDQYLQQIGYQQGINYLHIG